MAPEWGGLDAKCRVSSATLALGEQRRGKPLKVRFDENDDLVLEEIPDDLMVQVSKLAADRAVSEEDMWRELITKLFATPPKTDDT